VGETLVSPLGHRISAGQSLYMSPARDSGPRRPGTAESRNWDILSSGFQRLAPLATPPTVEMPRGGGSHLPVLGVGDDLRPPLDLQRRRPRDCHRLDDISPVHPHPGRRPRSAARVNRAGVGQALSGFFCGRSLRDSPMLRNTAPRGPRITSRCTIPHRTRTHTHRGSQGISRRRCTVNTAPVIGGGRTRLVDHRLNGQFAA
jgi:hypothetical protein